MSRSSIKLVEILPGCLAIRGHTRGLSDKMAFARKLWSNGYLMLMNVALIDDPEMAKSCRWNDVLYRRYPLRDSAKSGLDTDVIRKAIFEVADCLENIGGAVVHCDSGWNRSALVAIPAAAMHAKVSASLILQEVRKVRPKVLKNRMFENFVRENYG